jgi:zinc protease
MTLDRHIPPQVQPISIAQFPAYTRHEFKNGLQVFCLPFGQEAVVELQLIFDAHAANEPMRGLAALSARLMTEGTQKRSSIDIAETLDALGASIYVEGSSDSTTLTARSLTSQFKPLLGLVNELLESATFPEQEFELQRSRMLQSLSVEQHKTGWQAKRIFNQRLFGPKHPYQTVTEQTDIEAYRLDAISAFHQSHLQWGNAIVIVAGQFDKEAVLAEIERYTSPQSVKSAFSFGRFDQTPLGDKGEFHHPMPNHLQCTVRVGQLGFGRNHTDFYAMRMANMVLGGYFGSRLMQNIREQRGYTYGISSGWICNQQSGYFVVGTDVGNAFVEDTLVQIKLEIERLQNEPIPMDELAVAQNYYLGRMASEMETPFQLADRLHYRLVYGLPVDELAIAFRSIQELTAEQIQSAAQQHWKPNDLLAIVSGTASKE